MARTMAELDRRLREAEGMMRTLTGFARTARGFARGLSALLRPRPSRRRRWEDDEPAGESREAGPA
jgi:hypothetical protein